LLAPDDAYPKSTAAAKTALGLDDTLAWAHTTLAAIRTQFDYDWGGADQEFQRALELDPNNVPDWYPGYLSLTGRVEESIVWHKRARQLDPLSLPVWADVATYVVARRYDEATEELRKLLDIEPNYERAWFLLGVLDQYQGLLPTAIAEFERALSLSDRDPAVLARLGNAFVRPVR
jgi:Tfp pilus assembly protein PilF